MKDHYSQRCCWLISKRVIHPILQRGLLIVLLCGAAAELVAQQTNADSTANDVTVNDATASSVVSNGEQAKPASPLARFTQWLKHSENERRQQILDRGDYETLSNKTNDQRWQATGHFRRGEYEEAAERFADTTDDDAIYNQATAMARDGNLDESLRLYDDLLSRTPDHVDARHNRDVVKRLRELAQQQPSQDSVEGDRSEQGEQSEQNEQGEQGEQDEQKQSGAEQNAENSQQENDQSQQQQSAGEEQEGSSQPETAEKEDVDLEDLNDEAQQQAQESLERKQQQALQELAETPLTEQQQATEQWLRQIPDDPSGLLRRKLQQSHRVDHPDVSDARQPW